MLKDKHLSENISYICGKKLRYDIFLDTICHSDDRREEDVLLSVAKNLGNTMVGVNVDVHEILRRNAPLDDKGC